MDSTALSGFVGGLWDGQIVPQLVEYIRIPNKSPMFDAQWAEHGHMDQAVALMEGWARAQPIAGMTARSRAPGGPHAADLHRDARARATTPCCSTAIWTSSRR